jgi:hypothetical protein
MDIDNIPNARNTLDAFPDFKVNPIQVNIIPKTNDVNNKPASTFLNKKLIISRIR